MAIYIKQRRKKKVDKNCCSTYAHLYPTWHWVSPCCIFFTLGYVHRYNSSFFASKWGRGLKVDHQKIFIPPYHKDLTKGWFWNRYSSLAPIIWATLDGPHAPPSLLLEEVAVPRFLLTYIHAKLCFTSSIETLKYQPSKNSWLLPSKWYLRERERERKKERKRTKQNKTQYKKAPNCQSFILVSCMILIFLQQQVEEEHNAHVSLSLCSTTKSHFLFQKGPL